MGWFDSLVSQLIVNAPKAASQTVSQALGQAGGQAIGQALGQGFGGSIGGSSAPAGQGYTSPDAGDGYTEVEKLDVVAPRSSVANIAPASPLSLPSFGDVSAAAAPQMFDMLAGNNFASMPMANTIPGLEVVAPRLPSITSPDSVLSGMAPLTGLTSQSAGMPTSEEVYGGERSGGGMDEKGLLAMLGLGAGGAGMLRQGLGIASSLLPAWMMYNAIQGGQEAGNEAGAVNQAGQQATLGQIGQLAGQNAGLTNFLSNKAMANLGGNIGGPAMSAIQRAVRASQARIRSRYHQMGMSGSTAEGQDLQAAEQQGVETQFKIAQDMATQGLASIAQLTGQSMDAYARILAAQMSQGTALGNASAAFAGASATALGNALGKTGEAIGAIL